MIYIPFDEENSSGTINHMQEEIKLLKSKNKHYENHL
jgi:hypothetical protein